jgi:death-on-curing protein
MMEERVELAEFLAIAEAVLGIDAHALKRMTNVGAAASALAAPHASYGGDDFYPDPAQRAAILCSRIVRNHPLPDGNKRVAYLCMLVALDRAGLTWLAAGDLEAADMVDSLAARGITETEWVAWVKSQTH